MKKGKYINPKHNKLRLVYAIDKKGKVVSYCHIEHSEAKRMMKLLKFFSKTPGWVSMYKISKETKEKYPSVIRAMHKMAGALWADMMRYGKYEKLTTGRLIYVKKAMMNKRKNTNPRLSYLKASLYAMRATS